MIEYDVYKHGGDENSIGKYLNIETVDTEVLIWILTPLGTIISQYREDVFLSKTSDYDRFW